ncbi:MAG TPA: hypothetical protein DCW47_03590 [Lachnospiraceae bacterium]|nr:hypothetical protein [Lachnospiraceae bacterium]
MVKNVDAALIDRFVPLIPREYIDEVESGEMFCIGALKEDEEDMLPVGVLLFSADDGVINGTETATMIVISWLYVAEEHRMEGFANDMMEALSDLLEDSEAEGILCDVPFDSEFDLLEAFLTSWGFQFEVVDTQEMIISKDDCRRQGSSKYTEEELRILAHPEKPKGLVSILDIPQETFEEAVRSAKGMEKTGFYDLISENRDDYAGDVSYAIMHGDEISSLVLVERLPDNDLHMVLLRGFSADGAKELLKLMQYFAAYYFENYPEDTDVHLTLGTERSMNLAKYLFPDEDPIQVRRGFFY